MQRILVLSQPFAKREQHTDDREIVGSGAGNAKSRLCEFRLFKSARFVFQFTTAPIVVLGTRSEWSEVMLKIKLFGTGQANHRGVPLSGFPNQQSYLLLCYLLLDRHHPHHRERLAAIFWGESSTQTSRKLLRNVLWRLRGSLESAGVPSKEYLDISEDSVSWLCSSDYWLDVEVFETTIAQYQGLAVGDLTPEQIEVLEESVALYAGDLLENIYEDWCLYDRERLRLLYLSALSTLVAFHETNGSYERGLAYGKSILARDETRERVHRQMMRLYWCSGDRHAALAQYKRCAQILLEELGIPPMDETTLLYQQMSHNQFDPANWPAHPETVSTENTWEEAPVDPLAQHALQKLQHLQAMLEETSIELRQVERLISIALFNAKQL